MCEECDYRQWLESAGLARTHNRLRVLRIIGSASSPVTAQELLQALDRSQPMNRVTLYRTLDLLVEHKLVDRVSAGDRSFRFGLAPNANHPPHAHFYCTRCGNMECLNPAVLKHLRSDVDSLQEVFPAQIDKVEIRLDGVCKICLRRSSKIVEAQAPHPG